MERVDLFPPLIGARHKKRFHHHHHVPAGQVHHEDYCGNGLFWLVLLLFVGALLALILLRPLPPPPPPAKREAPSRKRTACTTVETYDSDVGMCGPAFRAPLAFDGSIMNSSVPACSSFYHMMCGTWISEHTNENRAFSYGYSRNQRRIEKLVTFESLYANGVLVPAPSTSPLSDFYRSCLRREGKKEEILEHRHMMAKILGGASSLGDMPAVFGKLARAGYTSPFAISIERHPTEARMLPLFLADGFGSLDEAEIIRIYQQSFEVHRLNILEQEQHISSVASIIRALRLKNARPAESIADYEEYVERDFPRDLFRFDALPQAWDVRGHERMRGAWGVYFQELDGSGLRFHHDQEVWIVDKPYFDWLFTQGLAQFTFRDWYAYCEFSILYNGHQFAPALPDNVYFTPLGKGARLYHRLPRASSPSVDCARLTQHMLPGLVARDFLASYFPQKDAIKRDVRAMVDRILVAFVDLIQGSAWLSASDRALLVNKVRSIEVRVLEPETWEPEPFAARISQDLYSHNLNMIRAYRVQRNLALWRMEGTLFDRVAFFAIPLTDTNAYYSGPSNSITILAGILQQPFFSPEYNEVSRYAILGSIIGHELSHALDHHGLRWGPRGSFHPQGIISPAGMRAFFQERAPCVVREYGPAPLGCATLDYGNHTLGEDVADLVGIQLAWDAYFRNSPGLLADRQHFFMALAQMFCETYDQQHMCEAVENDEHAVGLFRIDRTFRNMPQFHEAFSCTAGQDMFRENVCRVYGA